MTTAKILGLLRADGDSCSVRLEQVYGTGPDDLWSALTERDRLARWFAPVEGDLSTGGDFTILFDADDLTQQTAGTVIECSPPDRLVVSWRFAREPDSTVTVALEPVDGGTLLVLEHARLPAGSAAGYGAGWQAYLEQLVACLAGDEGRDPSWDERWAELLPAYQGQLLP